MANPGQSDPQSEDPASGGERAADGQQPAVGSADFSRAARGAGGQTHRFDSRRGIVVLLLPHWKK